MRVPGVFGPILTTGVALSAAVVVVTNPVTAPHADVRIPAAQAQVSQTGGQAVDMLDEDFIEALGPKEAASTNPLAVLKDLVGELVADAADLGRSAVMHAFTVGASVVSRSEVPELTAASYPFVVPPAVSTPGALPALDWTVVPGPVPEELRPVVEQALTAIMADYGDVADAGVIAAAFAAGVALAAEGAPLLVNLPGMNLHGLVDGPLNPALDNSGSAVSAVQRTALGAVIRDAVTRYIPPARVAPALPGRAESGGTDQAGVGTPSAGADLAQAVSRKPRPITVDRTLPALPGIGGPDSMVREAPARPVSGQGPLRSVTAPHRSAVSDLAEDARGSIGRAVKAHVDRPRN